MISFKNDILLFNFVHDENIYLTIFKYEYSNIRPVVVQSSSSEELVSYGTRGKDRGGRSSVVVLTVAVAGLILMAIIVVVGTAWVLDFFFHLAFRDLVGFGSTKASRCCSPVNLAIAI